MRRSTSRCTATTLNVLISGDMVLPRISTNVSVYDLEPEADPLALFLDSIAALRARCRPTRWCCPRTASPSAACTRASASCTSTTTSGWPTCWRPAASGRTRGRAAAGAVQAHARPAPDDLRDGRVDRAPACAVARRPACGAAAATTASGASGLPEVQKPQAVRPAASFFAPCCCGCDLVGRLFLPALSGVLDDSERRAVCRARPAVTSPKRVKWGNQSKGGNAGRAMRHAQPRSPAPPSARHPRSAGCGPSRAGGQFVRHHVVDHRQREVDQAPVQPDRAVGARRCPSAWPPS